MRCSPVGRQGATDEELFVSNGPRSAQARPSLERARHSYLPARRGCLRVRKLGWRGGLQQWEPLRRRRRRSDGRKRAWIDSRAPRWLGWRCRAAADDHAGHGHALRHARNHAVDPDAAVHRALRRRGGRRAVHDRQGSDRDHRRRDGALHPREPRRHGDGDRDVPGVHRDGVRRREDPLRRRRRSERT